MTGPELIALQNKARAIAKKWGFRDVADDFAQDVVVQALSGRATRTDWMLVDYLRREFGDSRSIGGRLRQFERHLGKSIDAPLGKEEDSGTMHDVLAGPGVEPERFGSRWRDFVDLRGREAMIAELVIDQEQTEAEVADILGVTPSRVCQIMRKVKEKMRAGAIESERADLYRDDPSESLLSIYWIAI